MKRIYIRKNPLPALEKWVNAHGQAVVLLLITGIWLFVFREYIFFRKSFVFDQYAIDTISQFFPIEYFRLKNILAGSLPFWSFQFDLGVSVYSLMVNINPFDLTLLLFGPDHFIEALPFVVLLKFLAAGLFFHAFLRQLDIDPLPAIIGSLLFTFSGYMIINSHWYHYTNYAVFIAVFLFLFERWLQQGKWLALVLVLGLLMLKGELQLFQMACFGAVYVLYRGVNCFGWSFDLIRLYLYLALFYTLGILIGAFEYVPNVLALLTSSRVEGAVQDASATAMLLKVVQLETWTNLQGFLARFLAADMLGAWGGYRGQLNYFEASTIYVGVLAVLLVPLALWPGSGSKRMLWLFPLTCLLVICFPFLRIALNGFASSTFKYLALYCGIFVLIPAILGLHHWLRQPGRGAGGVIAVWGFLVCLGLLVIVGMGGPGGPGTSAWLPSDLAIDRDIAMRVLIFALSYLLLLGMLWRWRQSSLLRLSLLVVIILEVALFSRTTVARHHGALDPFFVQRGESYFNAATAEALERIREQDQSFYRIEKGYNDGHLNDPIVQGYFGTQAYFGFAPGGIVNFYRALDLSLGSPRLASYRYGFEKRSALQSLLGVKYFLCRSEDECSGLQGFELLDTVAGVHIYQNEAVHSFGRIFYQQCPADDFNVLLPEEKDLVLLAAVVVESPLPALPVDCNRSPEKVTGSKGNGDNGLESMDAMQLRSWDEEHFYGSVQVEKAGALFFPVPYDAGWQVSLNGHTVKLLKIDYGFSGVLLAEPGTYDVALVYSPPFFRLSIIISLLALITALGLRVMVPRIYCRRAGSGCR